MKSRVASIVCIFCIYNIFSQEAEQQFTEYSKWSFIVQPSIIYGSEVNKSASPTLKFNSNFSYQAGVGYNFYQTKNFNFRTGLMIKSFYQTFDIVNITNEQLNAGFNYENELTDFEIANQIIVSQNIRVEYIKRIAKKINFVAGVGLNVDLRTSPSVNDGLTISVFDFTTETYKDILRINSNETQLSASVDLSIGFNFKTKIGLFQIAYSNNSQLLNYPKSGVYEFKNLALNSNRMGTYTIFGHYHSLSISYSPKNTKKNKN